MSNSFNARSTLKSGNKNYEIFRLDSLADRFDLGRLPYSLKILLENLLRHEDGVAVSAGDVEALAGWDAQAEPSREIAFTPARVILQDFTGVPAVVDLAAMRDAMGELGGDPALINPLAPAELVIDHSVQVDNYGSADAAEKNAEIEFERNQERYGFLRWGQGAFSNFRVVPPDTGIVHQVNLEYLARVVFGAADGGDMTQAYPDTVVGTDSHTTMINGIGVLGWGVGGIEAEAAMLGQPVTMLIPQVVGFRLKGSLPEGTTATDLVLIIVEMLRAKGVVGKFAEFFGEGLDQLSLADRATIANMAPEYGATCGIFPVDEESLRYLRLSGRSDEQVALVEDYARAQGLFRQAGDSEAEYTDVLELDLADVVPSISGPRRPQDRISLTDAASTVQQTVKELRGDAPSKSVAVKLSGTNHELKDGAIVVAAITSCTNTSNPAVLMAAGLVARKARRLGLQVKPWVKTSLAPGSLVVTEYLRKAGLLEDLAALGFHVVGYGCTTCIGNSGPLPEAVGKGIHEGDLVVSSVLSGNRNFEGRIHADIKMNFLASPPLVVAYALTGTMCHDLAQAAIGTAEDGSEVFLKDLWPTQQEVSEAMSHVTSEMFRQTYAHIFDGDQRWAGIEVATSGRFEWDDSSTYIKNPPYFQGMAAKAGEIEQIGSCRVLALLGDSITTDHISPAGAIKADSPAGQYLVAQGVDPVNFNSYGSRRGNHEVMMRGTFANIRLRNLLAPGTEGCWTLHQPSGEQMSIYDAAMRYQQEQIPLIILAGKEYGSGSSRDWAAKGTRLLGVKTVIAESYERIHRSNLVGMGVLPLQFPDGENAQSLGLTGTESYDLKGFGDGATEVTVRVRTEDGTEKQFTAQVRIDTPKEWEYYQHGGILHYVLRQLAA